MTQRCGRCKQSLLATDFSPTYRGRNGTWCRKCFAAHMRGETAPSVQHESRACIHCGETYTPKQLKAKASYCKPECKDRARKDRDIAARESAKPARHCVWCSEKLSPRKRSDARFCTAQCNSAAHQLTRKMWRRAGLSREDSALVLRTDLAARDGLDCYLCGAGLSLSTKHPDPLFASVDHVHPLALGGTNERTNLRLAHLVCNLRKRASLVTV